MERTKTQQRAPRTSAAKTAAPAPRSAATALPAVLLVDDVPANILALEGILKREDIELLTAHSGPAALEILLKREVALAIIDVQMPEMDGFELAELMRGVERTSYVPIIFVTAGARDLSRVFKGYESGAVDFLYKPIDNEILRSKVSVFVTLEKQRQQIRQAERMREMFVAILGHDLRNPLHGMMLSAESMLASSKDEGIRQSAERILGNGDRMVRMIEQLLDVTRFRLGGGISLSPRPADLRKLVEHVLTEFEHVRNRFQLEVAGDSRGTWDADRILQIVSNLVGNAVRYSPAASPIHIRIEDEDSDGVSLRVHNDGAPIPENLRGVLFDAFRAGDDADSREQRGLGLGLYITRQLVLAHGGALSFESSAEAGTTFVVSIPRHLSPAASDESEKKRTNGAALERSASAGGRAEKTILFVEDEPTSRLALGDLLKRLGYRVLSASRPSEALKVLERHPTPIHLLLTDVRLPEMGGEALATQLQIAQPELKVIFMSGLPDAPHGATAFVQKPIDFDTLAEIIDRTLA